MSAVWNVCAPKFEAVKVMFDINEKSGNISVNSNNAPCPNFSKQTENDALSNLYLCTAYLLAGLNAIASIPTQNFASS